MASVFELLGWRKLCSIHTFISSRHVVSFDRDDGHVAGELAAVSLT